MLPALLLAATVTASGAPVPSDTPPNPSGPAPRILAVKANAAGIVQVSAIVYEKRKMQTQYVDMENGKQVLKQREQEVTTSTYLMKNLEDFGGKFSAADGTSLTAEQAVKRAKGGATVLVPADGKAIAACWLWAVAPDAVILHTEELIHAHFQYGQPYLPATAPLGLVLLSPDAKGSVRVAVNPLAGNSNAADDFGGFNGPVRVIRGVGGRMVIVNGNFVTMENDGETLPDLKLAGPDGKKPFADMVFDAYDLTGKLVPRTAALKRLKSGGMVLFAGDNRFPDPAYLKVFHEDLLVVVSPELLFAPGQPNPYDPPVKTTVIAVRPMNPPAPPVIGR